MSRPNVASLVSGLFFTFVAAIFVIYSLGTTINSPLFTIGGPLVLIGIGAIGLLLSRRE